MFAERNPKIRATSTLISGAGREYEYDNTKNLSLWVNSWRSKAEADKQQVGSCSWNAIEAVARDIVARGQKICCLFAG